jgi:O-antigen/teichoic acid export membrane protein
VRLRLPAASSSAWVLAETATSAIFSFFSLMLIARVIGPDAAGTGAVAIAGFLLADIACASLFTDALVQRMALTGRHARSAVTVQVLVGLLGAGLLALLAPGLATSAQAPLVLPLTLALAALLPFSAFSGATAGLVLRQQRYRLLALRVLIGQPLGLLAGLLTAHAGLGAWAMVAQQAGATLATFLLLLLFSRQVLRPRLSRGAIADLWPIAGPQILSVIVLAGRYRLFVLALGIVTAEAVVAVCNVAFRLVDSALGVVWGSTSRLALPRFSMLQKDRAGLAEAYGDIAQLQALIGMPIAAGVALTAPDLVQALLGPAWTEAAAAAQVVAWVAVFSFTWGDAGSLFVALGKTRRNLLVSTITMTVPLTALLVARPETPVGVAICWAASTVAIAPWLFWLVLHELRRSPLWLLRHIAPALAATGTMSLAVMLLRAELRMPPLAELVMAAAGGTLVFAAVAWLALGRRIPRALHPMQPMAAAAE